MCALIFFIKGKAIHTVRSAWGHRAILQGCCQILWTPNGILTANSLSRISIKMCCVLPCLTGISSLLMVSALILKGSQASLMFNGLVQMCCHVSDWKLDGIRSIILPVSAGFAAAKCLQANQHSYYFCLSNISDLDYIRSWWQELKISILWFNNVGIASPSQVSRCGLIWLKKWAITNIAGL